MSEIVLVVPSRRVEQYTKESGVIPVNWEDVEFIVRTYGTFILAGEETPTSASWRGIALPPFFLLIS